jgi:ParB-like chromosome segregation protein Spo0J
MVDDDDDISELTDDQPLPERGYALPNQIQTHERFNLRVHDPADPDEMDRIERLAEAIERDGQMDDLILVPIEDNQIVLLAGHRRRRAVTLINERRVAQNRPPVKLRYYIDRSGGDALRKAIDNNLHRHNFSPIDLANLIQRIRRDYRWSGFKGAQRVAEYMGVSVATVTQYEKFLAPAMDSDLRDRLHRGDISAQSAFDLMNVKSDKRAEVLEKARDIQHDKDVESAIHQTESGRLSPERAAKELHSRTHLTNPAIKQAIRETAEATEVAQPMSRRELVEFILQFDSPAYGGTNGAVREWVVAMDRMMNGTGGRLAEKTARRLFDAMVMRAPKGTLDAEGKRLVGERSPTGRIPRRDKGKRQMPKRGASRSQS